MATTAFDRSRIMAVVREAGGWIGAPEIAQRLKLGRGRVESILQRERKHGGPIVERGHFENRAYRWAGEEDNGDKRRGESSKGPLMVPLGPMVKEALAEVRAPVGAPSSQASAWEKGEPAVEEQVQAAVRTSPPTTEPRGKGQRRRVVEVRYLDVPTAAEVLGVSTHTVIEWARKGRFKGAHQLRPGVARSKWLVPEAAVKAVGTAQARAERVAERRAKHLAQLAEARAARAAKREQRVFRVPRTLPGVARRVATGVVVRPAVLVRAQAAADAAGASLGELVEAALEAYLAALGGGA